MKLNKSHFLVPGILIIMLLVSTEAFAQQLPPAFGGDGDDVNDLAAPINGLIALGLAVGGYLGVRKLKK
ncbi:hypothetical protein [Psychroflexus sediminis]|uniref:VPEID-CTERM protein sorting domain-containing protein n=1 Tax=Psychroflexus sediminis TaxID=470826 RepID=A0A1G7TXH6_9FLAO|nr:hypothetical protein [Psychroflexus sediminis]SDG39986.1 hypothetical protein SAMN04488027_101121 [Psychroflexus sediminis]